MPSIHSIIDLLRIINRLDEMFLVEFNFPKFIAKIKGVQELILRGGTEDEKAMASLAMDRLLARAKDEMRTLPRSEQDEITAAITTARSQAGKASHGPLGGQGRGGPPPPRRSAPLYRDDMWVATLSGKFVGKIIQLLRDPNPTIIAYRIQTPDRRTFRFEETELRRATQEEVDAALAKRAPRNDDADAAPSGRWTIMNLGHYIDFEKNSDKIYGVAQQDYGIGWGGKSITFWGRYRGEIQHQKQPTRDKAQAIFRKKESDGYLPVDSKSAEYAYLGKLLAAIP